MYMNLLYKYDVDSLQFPNDVISVLEASRIVMESINNEKILLCINKTMVILLEYAHINSNSHNCIRCKY
jgi:hypothetical protein